MLVNTASSPGIFLNFRSDLQDSYFDSEVSFRDWSEVEGKYFLCTPIQERATSVIVPPSLRVSFRTIADLKLLPNTPKEILITLPIGYWTILWVPDREIKWNVMGAWRKQSAWRYSSFNRAESWNTSRSIPRFSGAVEYQDSIRSEVCPYCLNVAELFRSVGVDHHSNSLHIDLSSVSA